MSTVLNLYQALKLSACTYNIKIHAETHMNMSSKQFPQYTLRHDKLRVPLWMDQIQT